MSQSNPKLINLDFSPPPSQAMPDEHQPSDIRALMNQLQQTAFELRHRLSAVEDERNILAQQVVSMQTGRPVPAPAVPLPVHQPLPAAAPAPSHESPNDPLRLQNLDLQRQADGLRRALTASEKRVTAAQEQLASLRLARDSSQSQNRELAVKLAAAADKIANLQDDLERGPAADSPATPETQELQRALAQATSSTEIATKRIEALIRERDETTDKALQAQLELEVLRDRCRAMEEQEQTQNPARELETEILRHENEELKERMEAQRLETIDLATRFQAVQEQLKTVSATLGEVRLQVKANRAAAPAEPAPTPAAAAPAPAPAPELEASLAVPTVVRSVAPIGGDKDASAPALVRPVEPFSVPEAQATLKDMRRCYQAYARNTDDLSHLNELHCATLRLADQADRSGMHALERIAQSLALLVQELYHYPEQIGNAVLTTVVQSLEFLTTAVKIRDLHLLRLPADSSVCIVDDDPATCECILMAMETVEMQAEAYGDPAKALCELSNDRCDLIVLDVQMPGMDGFELCSEVRQQEHHRNTPVLFVTGRTEPEIRSKAGLSGGNDFMTKPFMLCELGLKALVMTAKAQLHMA